MFWCSGSEKGRNGAGIMVKEDIVEEAIEVKRLDDRVMKIAMVCEKKILHVFSVYAPQQGRPVANQVDLLMVAGDLNCYIGSTHDGFKDVMGCFNFGVRNQEEENILGLCQEHNLRVMNWYY